MSQFPGYPSLDDHNPLVGLMSSPEAGDITYYNVQPGDVHPNHEQPIGQQHIQPLDVKHNNGYSINVNDNIIALQKATTSAIKSAFTSLIYKEPYVTIDMLIRGNIPLIDVQHFGIYSWEDLKSKGLNKKHLLNREWLDCHMLGECLGITLKVLYDEFGFDINDVYDVGLTVDELQWLHSASVDCLLEVGLDKEMFNKLPYRGYQWVEYLHINRGHLDLLGMCKVDYIWSINNGKWTMNDLSRVGIDPSNFIMKSKLPNKKKLYIPLDLSY